MHLEKAESPVNLSSSGESAGGEVDASPRSLLLNVNAYVAPAFRKSGRTKLDSKESQESW